jgi:hypothetical protein
MTVSLEQIISVGPLQIAVISDCTITANHRNGAAIITGRKQPVAILIMQRKTLKAFGVNGNPMTRNHIEHLCPGAWRTALEAIGPQ